MLLPKKFTNNSSRKLIAGLIILSLASIIGLDYLASQQGGPAYFFSSSERPAKATPSPSLFEEVFTSLEKLGLPETSIQHHLDKQQILHLLINLPAGDYPSLASQLKLSLTRKPTRKIKIEAHQLGSTKYYLWTVSGEKNTASLLFQLHPPASLAPQKIISSPQSSSMNKVAIIIDDLGNSLQAIDSICNLGFPVTVSILPHSLFAPETAQIAHQHGLEILLHLPLEPLPGNHKNNYSFSNDNGAMINTQMEESEIIAFIDDSLRQIPHIVGVNNHQGSLITANPKIMKIILQELQKRGLFFIDSRTTSRSVAYQMARSMGLPTTYRKIFLDNEVNPAKIKEQLIKLLQRGRREGWAVAIGHPWEETLNVLKENKDLFAAYNCQPVFASELVH